ncbi:MAG: hypothetical protein V3R74_06135 [Alphaproteobacteria bacterium]
MSILKWSPAIPLLLAVAGVGFWFAVKFGLIEMNSVTYVFTVWADAGAYASDGAGFALHG